MRRPLALLLAVAIAGLSAGCAGEDPPEHDNTPVATRSRFVAPEGRNLIAAGSVSHDETALRTLIPALPDATHVSWLAGRLEGKGFKGDLSPAATHGLIAVVRLTPDAARHLRAATLSKGSVMKTPAPWVPADLQPQLPAGTFLRHYRLSEYLRKDAGNLTVTGEIAANQDILVVTIGSTRELEL
ncbi:hypothetical protein [Austwickia sp. TVS 96-490-7B]|uniref:hypothetical protein n=1 Tax=Austwickia sp. TVS 96-490-7B TaxID=2830843 RepID=UPI001C565933|nr:hypothetical protein [Austwickia sp. TVS 96-490-7B]